MPAYSFVQYVSNNRLVFPQYDTGFSYPDSRSNDEFFPFLALPIFMPLHRILQDVAAITAIVLNLYIFVSGLPKVSHSRSMLYMWHRKTIRDRISTLFVTFILT